MNMSNFMVFKSQILSRLVLMRFFSLFLVLFFGFVQTAEAELSIDLVQASKKNDTAGIEKALAGVVDIYKSDESGCDAFVYLLVRHNFKHASQILARGYKVDRKFDDGTSFLHWASMYNDFQSVEFLLQNGSDPNMKDNSGRTSLHYAVLYKSGIRPVQKTDVFFKANEAVSLADGVKIPAPSLTPLHFAVINNEPELVKSLIANGAERNTVDSYGKTPLDWAHYYGYDALVEILDEGLDTEDSNGEVGRKIVPAGYADSLKAIELLIKKGAKINETDVYGKTPLFVAVEGNNYRAAEYFMDNAADPEKGLPNGDTPLIVAVKTNCSEMVRLLAIHGAGVNRVMAQETSSVAAVKPKIVSYKKPAEYNLRLICKDININDPSLDRRSYYKVFIDKEESGRTTSALESQSKEFTSKVTVGRCLVSVEKYVFDEKKNTYVRLNNIYQPKPPFIYVDVPVDRIVIVGLSVNSADSQASYEIDFEKE